MITQQEFELSEALTLKRAESIQNMEKNENDQYNYLRDSEAQGFNQHFFIPDSQIIFRQKWSQTLRDIKFFLINSFYNSINQTFHYLLLIINILFLKNSGISFIPLALTTMICNVFGQYMVQAISGTLLEICVLKKISQKQQEISSYMHLSIILNTLLFLLMYTVFNSSILDYLFAWFIKIHINTISSLNMATEEDIIQCLRYTRFFAFCLFIQGFSQSFFTILKTYEIYEKGILRDNIIQLIFYIFVLYFLNQMQFLSVFSVSLLIISIYTFRTVVFYIQIKRNQSKLQINFRFNYRIFAYYVKPKHMINFFVKLFQNYLETFNYDSLTLFVCILAGSVEQIEAHFILINLFFINYQLISGITNSVHRLLLICIDEGWVNKSKNFTMIAAFVIQIVSFISFLLLQKFQIDIICFLIYHQEYQILVIERFQTYSLLFLVIFFLSNSINLGFKVMSALDFKKQSMVIHFMFYYLLEIPLCILLGLSYDDAVTGIWIGFTITEICVFCIQMRYLFYRLQWDIQIANIKSRQLQEKAQYI